MNKQSENSMDEQTLDGLLAELEHEVPTDFSQRVMHAIGTSANQVAAVPSEQEVPLTSVQPLSWLQWSALMVGGVLGVGQIARIVFGLWFSAAAW